jgi:hypothetical protein
VGEPPHWVPGLDLLGRFGYAVTVVPHWNNNSGGTHDTSRAFVGERRFERLRAELPPEVVTLGIDEYAACTLDFDSGQAGVSGAGGVTLISTAGTQRIEPGEHFSLDLLAPNGRVPLPNAHSAIYGQFRDALANDRNPADALALLHGLMDHMTRVPHSAEAQSVTLLMIREMSAELAVWLEADQSAPVPVATGDDEWIEAWIQMRADLRAAKQWALADKARDTLTAQGIVVEDSPAGPVWRRA